MDTKEGKEGWHELGDWDWHMYTIDTMYKIDNSWEPIIQPREPYSVLWSDLNEKEIQKKGDMWIHRADWLCYTVEK